MKKGVLSVGIGTAFSVILCAILGIPVLNSIASIACCIGGSAIAYFVFKFIEGKKK